MELETPPPFMEKTILKFHFDYLTRALGGYFVYKCIHVYISQDGFFPWRGGGLEFHIPILKNDFFENHLESFPDCENVFCT